MDEDNGRGMKGTLIRSKHVETRNINKLLPPLVFGQLLVRSGRHEEMVFSENISNHRNRIHLAILHLQALPTDQLCSHIVQSVLTMEGEEDR